MSLETPVVDGTKIAGVKNAAGEEVQSSRLVMGANGDTVVGTDNPLPVAIVSGGGGGGTGGASETTLAALSAKLPASLGAKAQSGSLSIVPATGVDFYPATQPVSGTVGISGTVPVSGTFFQTTQPISAASLPLPSGAATAAGVAAIVTALGSPLQAGGSVGITGTLPAFAATPTFNIGTAPSLNITNITGTVSLPTGAATSANQASLNALVAAIVPATRIFDITPSDSVVVTPAPRAIRIKTSGNLVVKGTDNTAVTIAVTAGEQLNFTPVYVMAATTAGVAGLA